MGKKKKIRAFEKEIAKYLAEKEEISRLVAKLRAEKIAVLAELQAERAKTAELENEGADLIEIAANVSEKLAKALPILLELRVALGEMPLGWGDAAPAHLREPVRHAFAVVDLLLGPVVARSPTEEACGSRASLYDAATGTQVQTACWASPGHEGSHGDDKGRSW